MTSRKPRVVLKCAANAYTEDNERIIEFSGNGKAGLISFLLLPNGDLAVDVYRCDAGVRLNGTYLSAVEVTT